MRFLYDLTRVFRFFEESIFITLTFSRFQMSVMQHGIQELFLLFLLSLSCLQQEQVWKRYAGSFLVTGQTTGSLIRCIMNLSERLKPYRRALNSLEKENRWKQEPSTLGIMRTNQFAEHAVKVTQCSKNHLAINSDVLPLGTASP